MNNILSEGYGISPKSLYKMPIGAYSKLVMAYFLSYTGAGTVKCWPSIERISLDLGICSKTSMKAIKELCEVGLIKKSKLYTDNRLKNQNMYTITFLENDDEVKKYFKGHTVPDGLAHGMTGTCEGNKVPTNINSININIPNSESENDEKQNNSESNNGNEQTEDTSLNNPDNNENNNQTDNDSKTNNKEEITIDPTKPPELAKLPYKRLKLSRGEIGALEMYRKELFELTRYWHKQHVTYEYYSIAPDAKAIYNLIKDFPQEKKKQIFLQVKPYLMDKLQYGKIPDIKIVCDMIKKEIKGMSNG